MYERKRNVCAFYIVNLSEKSAHYIIAMCKFSGDTLATKISWFFGMRNRGRLPKFLMCLFNWLFIPSYLYFYYFIEL